MFGIQIEEIYQEDLTEERIDERVLELMRALAENPYAKVKFYSYRTAFVYDPIFDAERESMLPLEYMLAIKAGVRPDNHTCYEVYNGCSTFYICCYDGLFRVGKTIDVHSW